MPIDYYPVCEDCKISGPAQMDAEIADVLESWGWDLDPRNLEAVNDVIDDTVGPYE